MPPRKPNGGPPDPPFTDSPPPSALSVLRVAVFGQPSTYSLPPWELARHIRQLRREGWQSWEIRARFDFERQAA